MDEKLLNKIIEIITTHDEGDGYYCDTGADMEWACRSHCVESAVERLMRAFENGELND